MSFAILFSSEKAVVGEAVEHLESHRELYWTVGWNITDINPFYFPILGFIHVNGGGDTVDFVVCVKDIVSYDEGHYDDPSLKPKKWREDWKLEGAKRPRRNTLIITGISQVPPVDIRIFVKHDGALVKGSPQGYTRVFPLGKRPR